eukprot:523543-Pleurochrysis_carterae.AAC.1
MIGATIALRVSSRQCAIPLESVRTHGVPDAWRARRMAYQARGVPGAWRTRRMAYQTHGVPGAWRTRRM